MQSELLTVGVQVAIFVVTSILGLLVYRREKRCILAAIDSKIQMAIDNVGEALHEVFAQPIVKGAMTTLGKQGGAAMQHKAITNKMALDVLASPKMSALKLLAKTTLNIDVDQYIEENGAVQTLGAAQELAGLVGVDLNQLMAGGLNGANLAVGHEANGNNYHLPGS